jgi:hypothetical protein
MRRVSFFSIWAVLVLAGCGSGGADGADPASSSHLAGSLASLPATVEGTLNMSAGEGDEDEHGQEVLFGMLTVAGKEYYVEVAPALVDAASIAEEIVKVRATLGSKQDLGGGVVQYSITALEKL